MSGVGGEPTANRSRLKSVHNLMRFSQLQLSNVAKVGAERIRTQSLASSIRQNSIGAGSIFGRDSLYPRLHDDHKRQSLPNSISQTRELAFGSHDTSAKKRRMPKISAPCWGRIVFTIIIFIAVVVVFFVRYNEMKLDSRLRDEYMQKKEAQDSAMTKLLSDEADQALSIKQNLLNGT